MKKIIVTALITGLALTACGQNEIEEIGISAEDGQASEEGSVEDTVADDSVAQENTEDNQLDISFADLTQYEFTYSSGAGAWSSSFHIAKDGYFYGMYNDSDMGDTGEGYPDGTVYTSNFGGQFTNLIKVSDYIYEMTISDMTYDNTPGTEELADNMRYVYETAAGIPEAGQVTLYMPKAEVSSIDSEIYQYYLSQYDSDATVLSNPVIVSSEKESGFYGVSQDFKESAEMNYSSYKSSYDYFVEEIATATSSEEKLEAAQQNANIMDQLLNQLWTVYKHNTDEASFKQELENQRVWISDKEAQMKTAQEACSDVMEGQIAASSKSAELTIDRCNQLVTLIKEL